jgi:hypothetical protein
MGDRLLVALADLIVVVHLAYLAFIPLGGFLAARAVRKNPTGRWPRLIWAHIAAVAVGLVSITVGFDCPLTTWEQSLRRAAGQHVGRAGFVDQYLAGRVFPHGDAWVVQVVFIVCVAVSWCGFIRRERRSTRPLLSPPG